MGLHAGFRFILSTLSCLALDDVAAARRRTDFYIRFRLLLVAHSIPDPKSTKNGRELQKRASKSTNLHTVGGPGSCSPVL